jgi:hypothetical protein
VLLVWNETKQRCEPDSRFLKTMGWEIGKVNKLKRDLAHGLWSGRIREARGNVSFMLSDLT